MNDRHLDDLLLDAFVSGASSPAEDDQVSTHVKVCEACAARLREFAQAEDVFPALARSQPPARSRSRRIAAGIALLAASLALVVAWQMRQPRHVVSPVAEAIAPVICPDGPDQRACVNAAHRKGLVVNYPDSAGAPLLGAAPLDVREWNLE